MSKLKQKLIELKKSLSELELIKEKSSLEMIKKRKYEPPIVKNAVVLAVRKNPNKVTSWIYKIDKQEVKNL